MKSIYLIKHKRKYKETKDKKLVKLFKDNSVEVVCLKGMQISRYFIELYLWILTDILFYILLINFIYCVHIILYIIFSYVLYVLLTTPSQ